MGKYIVNRILMTVPILVIISIVSFVIIQLPPGDYLSSYVAQLEAQGDEVKDEEIARLQARYGLGLPMHVQYFKWVSGMFRGNFGYSFGWQMPVSQLIGERLVLTIVISLCSLVFATVVAFPIGIYSAVRHHSPGDYASTFVGFIGLSVPNFMLALILMYLGFQWFGLSIGGLFSPEYQRAPWSIGKVIDLIRHLWIPVIVVGTAGTASAVRVMRNNLLDQLQRQYVITARAKGLGETRLLFKYPVRMAIVPFVSTVGWLLPELISGATITAVVLSLPTVGPLILRALETQDMYLAGTFVLLTAALTVIGTLISDILLAVTDPRIRYE